MPLISRWKIERLEGYNNHEMVSFFYDKKTGLRGFIAIHNTNLGPATGGTRYWHYDKEEDALEDVLKLSSAMTYKCALANLPYGGGKAVIMADSKSPKNKKFLFQYAKKVNLLNGKFYTGGDVGMLEKDVDILSKSSNFIVGRTGVAGDPSPWAALGVFYSIKVGLEFLFGSKKITGHTFAIKGLGKVGLELCRLLHENGGQIVMTDTNPQVLKNAKKIFPEAKIVYPEEIHKEQVDVYSPCALGKEFNKKTINQLNCKMVCGAANNQLVTEDAGFELYKRNILYIPDYVANSGGLINVKDELNPHGYSRKRVENKVRRIGKTVKQIIEVSKKKKVPTDKVSNILAENIFLKKHV